MEMALRRTRKQGHYYDAEEIKPTEYDVDMSGHVGCSLTRLFRWLMVYRR
jgi:hypothetical protein